MNPFQFLRDVIGKPDYDDPECVAELEWVNSQQFSHDTDSKLVLEHALRQYELVDNSRRLLDDKLDAMSKLCAALTTLLVGFFNIAKPQSVSPWFIACSLLLLALAVAIRARRAIELPRPPSIRDVMSGIYQAADREAWLAAALHKSVSKLVVAINWLAVQLTAVQILVFLALLCLLPIILALRI